MSGPTRGTRRVWTVTEVRALGVTCDIRTAAHVLGIGRTTAFALLRAKKFPVRTLQMGRVRRVPVGELLAYVGAGQTEAPVDPPSDPTSSAKTNPGPTHAQ
jgi:hypothetical protein